jgi:hypothetical protein
VFVTAFDRDGKPLLHVGSHRVIGRCLRQRCYRFSNISTSLIV